MDEMSNLTKTGMVLGGLAFGLGIEYLLRMKKAQEDQLKAAGTGGAAPATKATEASGSAAAVSKVVKAVVTVEYCGGWGYDRFFYALKKEVVNKFGEDRVEMTPIRNPGKTGNFEVRLVGAIPELIHSKTTRQQGRCETEEQTDAVLEQIAAFLESKKSK